MTDVDGCATFLVSFHTAQLEPDKIVPTLCVGTINQRQEKGDPKVAFCHCAYCLLNPGGTPCTLVSSHGPFGLMERLQPLLQR